MRTCNIMLNTINDVKAFVNTVSKYDFDVDLISGRYAICLLYTSPSPRDQG